MALPGGAPDDDRTMGEVKRVTLVRPAFAVPVVLLSTAVTGRDEHGNDVREATETAVDALAVWPRTFDEVTEATAVLPYGTTVHATDRLRIDGQVWEIEGEPVPFTGTVAGVEVTLRRSPGVTE